MTTSHRLIGLIPLVIAIAVGCRGSRQLELDLAAAFPLAEVRTEARLIDIGTADAAPALLDGFSWDESRRDGSTFAWSIGPSSTVRFWLAEARPIAVVLRGHPFSYAGAPDQVIRASINGSEIDRVRMRRRIDEYRVEVPELALRAGDNRLELRYGYSRRVRDVYDSLDRRELAVAWDEVRLEGLDVAVGTPAVRHTQELILPARTEVRYHLEGGPRRWLQLASITGPDEARLRVSWRTSHGAEEMLAELAPGPSETMVELPRCTDTARLSLTSVGGEVRIRRPVVVRQGSAAAESARVTPRPFAGPPPTILVYLVDTLRADRLGCYGGRRGLTPHLDALAEEGILFEDAVAQTSWTKPSVATILTGLPPVLHGVNTKQKRLPDTVTTLAEALRAGGYTTAAFTTNAYITREQGFAQGFDHFRFARARAHQVNRWALEWLDSTPADRPRFLYVHTIDPHAPYEPRPRFRSKFAAEVTDPSVGTFENIQALGRFEIDPTSAALAELEALYDAEVAQNDHAFGQLLAGLKARDLLDTTLVVFLSDHGEEFNDHGSFGHGVTLYREMLNIPLAIRPPGGCSPRRVSATVQHLDLMPTLLEVAGAPVPPNLEGCSLMQCFGSDAVEPPPRPAISYLAADTRVGFSVTTPSWKLVQPVHGWTPRSRELFDRRRDPAETTNLAWSGQVRAGYLATLVRAEQQRLGTGFRAEDAVLDERTREGLRALGYVH